jgi:hypothetical protein
MIHAAIWSMILGPAWCVNSAWSSARPPNKAVEIMASQEKKKTRGTKKVRKAGKKQRREKISKSGKPKA